MLKKVNEEYNSLSVSYEYGTDGKYKELYKKYSGYTDVGSMPVGE